MRKMTLPVLTPKKTLGGDLLKKEVQKALTAGTLKPFDANDIVYTIPAGAETDNGTNGLTPKVNHTQEQDAALVAKLSPSFPIQEWDSMSTKAQRQAMKFSGLAEPEQWRLLNSSAPLSVLDAANRERIRPVAPTGAGNSTEILTNPSKTPYLQNGESDGQLGKGKGLVGSKSDKPKSIFEYPAITYFVDAGNATGKQKIILTKAQIKLATLGVKGYSSQQEIDDILAGTCTKMLTDENRPDNDLGDKQGYIPAITDVIDQYLHRKREQGEAAVKSFLTPPLTLDGQYSPDVDRIYSLALLDFFFGNFPEGKYDLRHMPSWEAEITDYSPSVPPFDGSRFLFVYDGDLLSVEDLGNAMYGFYGMALGFSVDDLYKGAGLASRAGNAFDDDPQTIPDRNNGYLGDDAEDRAAVNLGIKWYLEGKGK